MLIQVYTLLCTVSTRINNKSFEGIGKHRFQDSWIEINVPLRTIDAGMAQELRNGVHVARAGQHLACEGSTP